MTDWEDNFRKLEERLSKVVSLFQRNLAERRALLEEVEKLRTEVKERVKRCDGLERDLQALRREREDVKGRIEKLLQQIDMLTKSDSAG